MTIKDDLAVRRIVKADDRSAGRGFARTGLADQTVGLAFIDIKTDAVDGLGGLSAVDAEVLLQPFNME